MGEVEGDLPLLLLSAADDEDGCSKKVDYAKNESGCGKSVREKARMTSSTNSLHCELMCDVLNPFLAQIYFLIKKLSPRPFFPSSVYLTAHRGVLATLCERIL